LPYKTIDDPTRKLIDNLKSNIITDAIDDKTIEIEVANPLRMLSAYLINALVLYN
jgi:hypothetical protein